MAAHRLAGRWQLLLPIPRENGTKLQLAPQPHIRAHLQCPKQKLGGVISFLIDTGADITVIMPDDREEICIPNRLLVDGHPSFIGGIGGGLSLRYLRNITLEFHDESGELIVPFRLDQIAVACPKQTKYYKGKPSILGRDFLSGCAINISSAGISLLCENTEDNPYLGKLT